MSEIPKSSFARGAKLASLPMGVAGRTALGIGKRVFGQSAELVLSQIQAKTAEQVFKVLGELKGGAMKFGQALSVFEAALPEEVEAIRTALESSPGVERVIHLRTVHVGPDELLVGAKIAVKHSNTGREIAEAIDEAEAALRTAVPTARYVFLEPDIDRTPTSN